MINIQGFVYGFLTQHGAYWLKNIMEIYVDIEKIEALFADFDKSYKENADADIDARIRFIERISPNFDEVFQGIFPGVRDLTEIAYFSLYTHPQFHQANFSVLSCGTLSTLLSQRLMEKKPTAHVTFLEQSEFFLDVARYKFRDYPERTAFYQTRPKQIEPEPPYDFIIVEFRSCFIPEAEKSEFFKNIYESLKPNGVLVVCEMTQAAAPEVAARQQTMYRTIQRTLGKSNEAIDDQMSYMSISKETDLLMLMQNAGFRNVDMTAKLMNIVEITAQK
jgi:tRNA (cmo5U34)-methyltransferase